MIYYPDGNPAENGLLITPQMIEETERANMVSG